VIRHFPQTKPIASANAKKSKTEMSDDLLDAVSISFIPDLLSFNFVNMSICVKSIVFNRRFSHNDPCTAGIWRVLIDLPIWNAEYFDSNIMLFDYEYSIIVLNIVQG